MMIMIFAFFLNLIFNFLLVPNYGAIGAALSTGLSFYIFFILKTELSIKANLKLKRGIIHVVVGACVVLTVASTFNSYLLDMVRILWFVIFLSALISLRYVWK
jgi:O-antigen/teichoic acid export membrane protein